MHDIRIHCQKRLSRSSVDLAPLEMPKRRLYTTKEAGSPVVGRATMVLEHLSESLHVAPHRRPRAPSSAKTKVPPLDGPSCEARSGEDESRSGRNGGRGGVVSVMRYFGKGQRGNGRCAVAWVRGETGSPRRGSSLVRTAPAEDSWRTWTMVTLVTIHAREGDTRCFGCGVITCLHDARNAFRISDRTMLMGLRWALTHEKHGRWADFWTSGWTANSNLYWWNIRELRLREITRNTTSKISRSLHCTIYDSHSQTASRIGFFLSSVAKEERAPFPRLSSSLPNSTEVDPKSGQGTMANIVMASSFKTLASCSSSSNLPQNPNVKQQPTVLIPAAPSQSTGGKLQSFLLRMWNPSSRSSITAATVSAATALLYASPSLSAEIEKAALFDFNLTLPAIALEFVLLMVALDKIYYTPLGKFMDERDAAIRESLNSVKDTSEEVKQLEEQATAVMKAARAEISAALNTMKKETSAELEEKLKEGRKKVEAELAEALQKLEKQKEDTIKALDSQIAALSQDIVNKVLPL
ncbi:hypothetical protein H6P81_014442 [Aristolochia fimbriata]|uniref:ATP synthase subunit b', chloroplastic n=1 Tax=Aristolochia fimbriata TaxID=158543 RepID=A0AAV7EJ15_ARIFI|nr:hypothetical protein H6P81_014442 [Aristolochia fimbriata]